MALKTTKGAIGEKKFITHGMGVQISHSLGTEAAAEGDIREVDMPVRYGGEELLLLISHTDLAGAVSVAERIRTQIASHRFQVGKNSFFVTISLGVASYHSGDTLDSLIKRADTCLYHAKRSGRNRVATEEAL